MAVASALRKNATTIDEEFEKRFPSSAKLFERARGCLPSGVTHDSRNLKPFPVYVHRTEGAYKWDVDGNRLLDYWMGHGAMLLGYNHPEVMKAIHTSLARGTHISACTEDEVEYAETVQRLVPTADLVRFTMSGTESVLLGMRIMRAAKGKSGIIRFNGHYHGWHDAATVASQPPFDIPSSGGVPQEIARSVISVPPNDIEAVRKVLDERTDIAGVMLEPGGGANGVIRPDVDFLKALRKLTEERGVLLMFDEVITAFRYSLGGAQEYYGVMPDLTTMGKIVAGGLPGGAVAGRREVMEIVAFSGDKRRDRFERAAHAGTFNCILQICAAGVTTMKIIELGAAIPYANRAGEQLRQGMRDVLKRRGVPGSVVGECSAYNAFIGEEISRAIDERDVETIMGARGPAAMLMRKAMLLEGVDWMRTGGLISTEHGDAELEFTIGAFDRAIERVEAEGAV